MKHFVRRWNYTRNNAKRNLLIYGLQRIHARSCVEILLASYDATELNYITLELGNHVGRERSKGVEIKAVDDPVRRSLEAFARRVDRYVRLRAKAQT